MKTLTTLSFTITLLFATCNTLIAQEFHGKAVYQSKTTIKLDNNFGGRQISEQQKKEMMSRMKSFLEKTYTLTFTQSESIYKEDETLNVSEGRGPRGGFMFGGGNSGITYKNIKTNQVVQQQEFLGKQFLIKDSLQPLKWKMGSESKKIGQYICFKATATKPFEGFDWKRNKPDENEKNTEKLADSSTTLKTPREIEIVAWYTPQIAVSHGPLKYWGLPGLILELSADNTTVLCTKIVINPSESESIKPLKKGKVVTQKEYNKIVITKSEEMKEMFKRRRNNK